MQQMFHVQRWEYQPSHNIFIYIAASTGILGLALFVWILWKIFSSTWNAPSSDWKFTLLVLGFSMLFVSLFDHFLVTIQQGQLIFALILGLMLSYSLEPHPDRT
jgi:O-antigen ligase